MPTEEKRAAEGADGDGRRAPPRRPCGAEQIVERSKVGGSGGDSKFVVYKAGTPGWKLELNHWIDSCHDIDDYHAVEVAVSAGQDIRVSVTSAAGPRKRKATSPVGQRVRGPFIAGYNAPPDAGASVSGARRTAKRKTRRPKGDFLATTSEEGEEE